MLHKEKPSRESEAKSPNRSSVPQGTPLKHEKKNSSRSAGSSPNSSPRERGGARFLFVESPHTSHSPSPSSDPSKEKRKRVFTRFFQNREQPFDNTLSADTALENFREKVQRSRENSATESDSPSSRKYNEELGELQSEIEDEIERRNTIIERVNRTSSIDEKKAEIAIFAAEQARFLEEQEKKLEEDKQILLIDKQKELYDKIRIIVIDPFWSRQANQTFGGEVVVDKEDKKMRVPTGIEKMIRVITDCPLPSRKSCCCFFKPTPASRHFASKEIKLSPTEILDNINQIKKAADERLKNRMMKSNNKAALFYSKLMIIDLNQLSDINAVKTYIQEMEDFYGFVLRDDFIQGSEAEPLFPKIRVSP